MSTATVPVPESVSGARHRGRPAWRILASLVSIAAILWGGLSVVNLLAHQEHHFTRTFSGSITSLAVSTDRGSVRVIGSDRDDVTVSSYLSDGLGGTEHTEHVRGRRLVLDASCAFPVAYWCTASYTVRVPRNVRVVLWSGSGDVSVSGVRGAVDLTSQHGDLNGVGLRARVVHADTDHGSVDLRFVDQPEQVLASTSHGDVTVTVPRGDAAYRVELSTAHGATSNELRTDPTSQRLVQLSTQHGDVTARSTAR